MAAQRSSTSTARMGKARRFRVTVGVPRFASVSRCLLTRRVDTFLIAVNMTTSWDWKVNISEILINKTANVKTGTYPP